MKTLQEYINQYSNVAQRLGYSGESINILVQLLANASYIEEVENIAYTREASLDKAMLMNSKIQQCMDCMYSVYRGHCPRVVLSVKFLKPVSFRKFDRIIVSTNFSVYYIGEYIRKENSEKKVVEWEYCEHDLSVSATNMDNTTRYIVGFMSPKTSTKTIQTNNFKSYYIESTEGDLSNDVQVTIDKQSPNVTRQFADHILEPDKNVFDLTTTDYGSRIYLVDYLINKELWYNSNQGTTSDTTISATFYRYSHLESYNTNELSRIVLKGAEYVPFDIDKDHNFLYGKFGYPEKGIVYIKETERDALNTIHYKANKSRFLNTILRSNSDVGYLLEETYPEKVKSGGTYYKFSTNGEDNFLDIYYIPSKDEALSNEDIKNFKKTKTAYYVLGNNSENINIIEGTKWTVKFEITLELFKSLGEDYYTLVGKNILQTPYENRFGIIFDEPLVEEIKTQIGKLDNVKRIVDFNIIGVDEFGNQFENLDEIDIPESVYYKIDYAITTVVRQ